MVLSEKSDVSAEKLEFRGKIKVSDKNQDFQPKIFNQKY